jgi:DNA (cytosine-5)-methyltransferase 1
VDSDLPVGPTVFDAIGDLPDIDRFPELLNCDVLEYPLNGGSEYALKLRGALPDTSNYSHPRQHDSAKLTGSLRAEHTQKSRDRFSNTEPGKTEPISRFLRLAKNGVCNTLRAGTATDHGAFTSPRPIHPIWSRCISVREAARLHSYPDWFRFHRTIWHGFRQIGNSVPPLLARAIGAEVIRSLGIQPTRPPKRVVPGLDSLATLTMREAAAHFDVSHTVIPARTRREKVG